MYVNYVSTIIKFNTISYTKMAENGVRYRLEFFNPSDQSKEVVGFNQKSNRKLNETIS